VLTAHTLYSYLCIANFTKYNQMVHYLGQIINLMLYYLLKLQSPLEYQRQYSCLHFLVHFMASLYTCRTFFMSVFLLYLRVLSHRVRLTSEFVTFA